MTETITVNGVDRSSVIRRKDCEWAESAYLGEVGEGKALIEDAAGTIVVPGFKDISVDQSSSTPARIFTGFAGRKGIKRGEAFSVGASREIDLATRDGNALLQRLKILADTGNRTSTSATVATELTWLLADELSRVGVSDYGAVEYPTDVGVDPVDRRDSFPGDVLSSLARACRRNYYVRWNSTHSGWELVFRDDNASTDDTSTVSIANDDTANGTSVFAPQMDSELGEDPEHVYSRMVNNYAKDRVVRIRAATATAFVERDGEMEDSAVKNAATAARDADTALWESHTEEQILPVTIRMRAAYVGLVQAGQRISTRMTHMAPEGWDPAQYARILRKRITQPLNTDFDYDVALDLSPQEAGPAQGRILQSVFGRTAEGGGYPVFANPVTLGSKLIYLAGDRGQTDPGSPNTLDAQPRWGAGAWTRYNGATISTSGGDGCAAYWKVADATDQESWIPDDNCIFGAWELSGADAASATVAYVNSGTGTADYALGSLGTVASTDIALALWMFGQGDWPWGGGGPWPWATPNPAPGLSAGFTQRISKWAYDSYVGDYYKVEHAWVTIADAVGTGAALNPTITPGLSGKNFAGIALKVPAL